MFLPENDVVCIFSLYCNLEFESSECALKQRVVWVRRKVFFIICNVLYKVTDSKKKANALYVMYFIIVSRHHSFQRQFLNSECQVVIFTVIQLN